MENGIVRNELVTGSESSGWDDVLGVDDTKDKLINWAAVAVRAGGLPRSGTGVSRIAAIEGPPGTGKSTLARNLPTALARVFDLPVRCMEIAAHQLMSGEHGRTQQETHRLISEVVPEAAGDDVTVVVIDEVEALAMPRGAVSMEANPVDVHRTTDAVITALDEVADSHPNIMFVVTTNFPDLVDAALTSRADIVVNVPLPGPDAVEAILRATLRSWSAEFVEMKRLADSPEVRAVATVLADLDTDSRQVRKFVLDAVASDRSTASDPNALTIGQLVQTANRRRDNR